jgi:hypothetical protein
VQNKDKDRLEEHNLFTPERKEGMVETPAEVRGEASIYQSRLEQMVR